MCSHAFLLLRSQGTARSSSAGGLGGERSEARGDRRGAGPLHRDGALLAVQVGDRSTGLPAQRHRSRHRPATSRSRLPAAWAGQLSARPRGTYRCKLCRQEQVADRRRRVKRILVDEAGGSCALCGYDRCVAALQFHHLDPTEKCFALSSEGSTRGIDAARAEARKCVLLCGNCHAEVEAGVQLLVEAPRGGFEPPRTD
jgi:hypothetical protein